MTTNKVESNDAKRWLIIGAHKAGATEKQIAKMCGINQPSVRRIILNFQTTGSPCISKGLSQKEKSKPIVEYDEEGNLIDSDDEQIEESPLKQRIKSRRPSAKDLIAYVLNKAQQSEKKQSLFVKQEEDEKWCPPTPPRDFLHQQYDHKRIKKPNHSRSTLSPPLSEPSISPKPKFDVIKGFETWTMDEDKILMAHVLTRLSGCRWKEAELKLKGKHNATDCEKRWKILKELIIRGAEKSGTRGW